MCQTCDRTLQCEFTEPDSTSCCGVRCKGCTVDQIHYSSGATWSHDNCRQVCSCHAGIVTCVELLLPDDRCVDNPITEVRFMSDVVFNELSRSSCCRNNSP